ncbi:hypothetical protein LBMAG53_09300 [Planctomycetota bacterium]|nr:hypothetical protein LBMAG53_09300 [Planctomycetota bacterium]
MPAHPEFEVNLVRDGSQGGDTSQQMDLPNLCRLAAQGDAMAFTRLVDATQDDLMPLACLLTHDSTLAEDCLQECYMIAWRKRSVLDGIRDPAAWLRVVLRQVAANARRRRDTLRAHERPLIEGLVTAQSELTELAEDWGAELVARLRSCVEGLSPTARHLVEAHYREGTPLNELATEAGRSASWSRMTLLRIRQVLATCLARAAQP